MAASNPIVRCDKKGSIAEVVLDRGKTLNKMDDDFFESFSEAVHQADSDVDVRVIIVWAEGALFTAGLDLFKAGPALAGSTCPNKLGRNCVPHFSCRCSLCPELACPVC